MLQRGVFMPTLIGITQSAVQGVFEIWSRNLAPLYSFSIVHCSGCCPRRAASITWATLVSATS
jgi:hypothetical protein